MDYYNHNRQDWGRKIKRKKESEVGERVNTKTEKKIAEKKRKEEKGKKKNDSMPCQAAARKQTSTHPSTQPRTPGTTNAMAGWGTGGT